ncbi:anion permease [Bacillus sp. ISL-47]|uniref:SLC13 family permease n=1 Tax=Bacillus sp. ISL-47 TaxID=2819130 RepID=UPI001BEAF78C|nr:SLC13 family permease [Bacillus sp. ISL-47]MBT2686898.1 anion permease [Bacillus sp. ISL-47]MBT2710437.1 anion permease [Pseudomonas sp. ISL-84]
MEKNISILEDLVDNCSERLSMNLEAIVVCLVLFSMFIVLIKEWLLPEFTVFLAMGSLILTGILSPKDALSGFSNPGVHTVAFLFILGASVSKSGILDDLLIRFLKDRLSLRSVILRLMIPVSGLSAFMNNTPIVTMLIPPLQTWAITHKIKPSKLLIPLSYAAILGGTITLIGTSTNLVIQGLLLERGLKGFHLFDFSLFGIPLALAGIIYFIAVGFRLLPDRTHSLKMFEDEKENFISKFEVKKDSNLIGKTIIEAMLRNLNQLFLIEIIRKGKTIIPDPYEEVIHGGDILVFSGNPQELIKISELIGLEHLSGIEENEDKSTLLYEVVISGNSPLINKKIRESQFRSKYHAVIVAIKRKGTHITTGIGNIEMKPGDTLLLLAKSDFPKSWSDSEDFYFLSSSDFKRKQSKKDRVIVAAILTGILMGSIFQILPIYQLTMLAAVSLLLLKTITVTEAIKSINWNVIILMGSAIGIGRAVELTGLGQAVAQILAKLQTSLGVIGILIVFYLITLILTEILNNLATAALMFPIGFSISSQLNLDPMMFAIVTAIAASCSFLTPIGYQTNLLVYGPGGYKFTDYLKVGLPLSFICMFITISLAALKWL